MASGRRAWTAARASASRAAGVTAAPVAVLIRAGRQRQDHRLGPRGAADPGGRVGEDQAVLLAVPRQGPQRGEGLAPLVAAQRGDRCGGVAGGDLAQVIVAPGPLFQERVHAAEVDAGGVRGCGAGTGACRAAGRLPSCGRRRRCPAPAWRACPRSTCPGDGRGRRRAARRWTRISAVRETLRSRGRSAGSRDDQGIFSPGTWEASMTARARRVSSWMRGFQPRASPSREAMALACSRAGLLTDAAVQCREWNSARLARDRQFQLLPAGIRRPGRDGIIGWAGAAADGGSSSPRRRTTADAI